MRSRPGLYSHAKWESRDEGGLSRAFRAQSRCCCWPVTRTSLQIVLGLWAVKNFKRKRNNCSRYWFNCMCDPIAYTFFLITVKKCLYRRKDINWIFLPASCYTNQKSGVCMSIEAVLRRCACIWPVLARSSAKQAPPRHVTKWLLDMDWAHLAARHAQAENHHHTMGIRSLSLSVTSHPQLMSILYYADFLRGSTSSMHQKILSIANEYGNVSWDMRQFLVPLRTHLYDYSFYETSSITAYDGNVPRE